MDAAFEGLGKAIAAAVYVVFGLPMRAVSSFAVGFEAGSVSWWCETARCQHFFVDLLHAPLTFVLCANAIVAELVAFVYVVEIISRWVASPRQKQTRPS